MRRKRGTVTTGRGADAAEAGLAYMSVPMILEA
jgi:hypothetical protein